MYEDYAWEGLDQGWYAYGVKALYTSGQYSPYTVSNIVGHLMVFQVTVNATRTTGEEPVNVHIMMQGLNYPYETYTGVTPPSGTVVFDMVWKGYYYLTAFKIGYETYEIPDLYVYEDMVIDIVLGEKRYPPTNLYVDAKTLIATWNEPLVTAVAEDFEGAQFPPAGWLVVFCLLMMVRIMKGRCCPKGGWRQRSAPEDDLQETMTSRRERR